MPMQTRLDAGIYSLLQPARRLLELRPVPLPEQQPVHHF